MDYKTKPISRDKLRIIAKAVRQAFGCKNKLCFDVIDAFERASDIFPFLITTVVENYELPPDIPARCTHDFNGNYIIEVKNSIYEGAVAGIGGYRGHILHEICHGILCYLGFTPVIERTFRNNELSAFESMEWQAKALCGCFHKIQEKRFVDCSSNLQNASPEYCYSLYGYFSIALFRGKCNRKR